MIRIFVVAALGFFSVFAAGCSGAGDPPPPLAVQASADTRPALSAVEACQDHEQGCPCDEPGQVVECGRIKRVSGNYVWCATGHQTCTDDGDWGKCQGDEIAPAAQ